MKRLFPLLIVLLVPVSSSVTLELMIENSLSDGMTGNLDFEVYTKTGWESVKCTEGKSTGSGYTYSATVPGNENEVFYCDIGDGFPEEGKARATFMGQTAEFEYGETGNIILKPDLVITGIFAEKDEKSGFTDTTPLLNAVVRNEGDYPVCGIEVEFSASGERICVASSDFCIFPDEEWTVSCRAEEILATEENSMTGMSVYDKENLHGILVKARADPEGSVEEYLENNNEYEEFVEDLFDEGKIPEAALLVMDNDKYLEYGKLYKDDNSNPEGGDSVSIKIKVSVDDSYIFSPKISLLVRDIEGNLISTESGSDYFGSGLEKVFEIEFSEEDGYFYYIYAIVNHEGNNFHTTPGGFFVYLDGWKDNLPDEFDWRDAFGFDWTSYIKDQGSCGSCTHVAVADTMGMVFGIEQGNPDIDLDFSEQQLVSCAQNYADGKLIAGGGGCSGSWVSSSLSYIHENGITEEAFFSYSSQKSKCTEEIVESYDYYVMRCPEDPISGSLVKKYHSMSPMDPDIFWDEIDESLLDSVYYYRCVTYETENRCRNDENICSDVDCSDKEDGWDESLWSMDYGELPENTESLKASLIERGPFVSHLKPVNLYHRIYDDFVCSDIYYDNDPWCDRPYNAYSDCYYTGGHAIVISGFSENGDLCEDYGGYWITKNTYGDEWYEDGYGKVCYGSCDVQGYPYYMEGVHHV